MGEKPIGKDKPQKKKEELVSSVLESLTCQCPWCGPDKLHFKGNKEMEISSKETEISSKREKPIGKYKSQKEKVRIGEFHSKMELEQGRG